MKICLKLQKYVSVLINMGNRMEKHVWEKHGKSFLRCRMETLSLGLVIVYPLKQGFELGSLMCHMYA